MILILCSDALIGVRGEALPRLSVLVAFHRPLVSDTANQEVPLTATEVVRELAALGFEREYTLSVIKAHQVVSGRILLIDSYEG